MLEVLRNLARRKLRSALTISGILIGIFALTTMGALAEHFNAMLAQGQQFFATNIPVGPPPGQQTALLPLDLKAQIAAVDGVRDVYPNYRVEAVPASNGGFGAPVQITNEMPGTVGPGAVVDVAQGHDLSAPGQVVLGPSLATTLKVGLGQVVDLPKRPDNPAPGFVNHPFKVVGILAPTGSWTDNMGLVGTADAQTLFHESLPAALRAHLDVSNLTAGFTVFAKPGTSLSDMDAIAARIDSQVPGVHATKPSAMVQQLKSTGAIFTAVITGAAVLALVVGGLSVINTMIMAVTERVREIGLKKALGAHTADVMREYLVEATVIGVIGGVAGYLLGLGLTQTIDVLGKAQNLDIFLVTPRLTALGIGFAVVMATLAGIIPALRAARLDPVAALRNAG